MKKVTLLLLLIGISKFTHAQTWEMQLNSIPSGRSGNFGTSSSDPVNFYTNNTERMVLGSDGSLKLNSLAGAEFRFLQTDMYGIIQKWNGSSSDANKFLAGDGVWKLQPFTTSGSNYTATSTAKFGIGISSPSVPLDVYGDAKVSEYFGAKGISLGNAGDYGAINYIPATSTFPAVFQFGARPSTGASSGTFPNQNTDGGVVMPNPNNDFCISNMVLSVAHPITSYPNDIIINKLNGFGSSAVSYGNVRVGHDGTKGYIEVQGTNPGASVSAPLSINFCGKRNVYVFGGETFASSQYSVMSVTGKLNVADNMQVGANGANNFLETSKLYVAGEGASDGGIKVRQDNYGYGLKVVKGGNGSDDALSVFSTNDGSDGSERFRVQADGETNIITSSINALIVSNVNHNGSQSFLVQADGKTKISTTDVDAFIISDLNDSGAERFFVQGDGKTRISTTNVDAFTISDSHTQDINFKVKKNGHVYAREVVVTLNGFPDYVFSKEYALPKLEDVKSFIQKNHRLPKMPSAKEVEASGANLGEIQKVTVEKVEELYLYILQLEEKLNDLNNKLKTLKNEK